MLNENEINYLKNHKNQITPEILECLRKNNYRQLALDILDLPQDEEKYYLDAFGNRISYDGDRGLKKPFTNLKLSEIHFSELKKCSEDIDYFMLNYVKITTPKGIDFPDLREYQKEFIQILKNDEYESVISLQGRQSGKSITIAIWICWSIIFEKNINIGICANKFTMAQEFIDKIRKIFYLLPIWMTPSVVVWNKLSLEFENRVKIMCDATSQNSFRGFTMNYIIVDETAFIRQNVFMEFMDSIMPSQSALAKKKNVLISTANGQNHFFDIWKFAGDSLENSRNGYVKYEVDYRRVPRYNSKGELIPSEIFKNEIVKKYGLKYFEQNYGNSFLGSSNTLIKAEIIDNFKSETPDFEFNGLKIYKEPQENHKYIIGIDTSKNGGDYFSIQVLDVTNINFKQVASAKLQIDYLDMPELIVEWAEYYNTALLIIENNEGSGQSINDIITKNYEYENVYYDNEKKYAGFRTTKKSRDIILHTLKLVAESEKLEIVDNETIKELKSFILINGKYQADNGKHDDLVMALSLCFGIFVESKNFEDIREVIKELKSENSTFNFINSVLIGSFESHDDNFLKDIDGNFLG